MFTTGCLDGDLEIISLKDSQIGFCKFSETKFLIFSKISIKEFFSVDPILHLLCSGLFHFTLFNNPE